MWPDGVAKWQEMHEWARTHILTGLLNHIHKKVKIKFTGGIVMCKGRFHWRAMGLAIPSDDQNWWHCEVIAGYVSMWCRALLNIAQHCHTPGKMLCMHKIFPDWHRLASLSSSDASLRNIVHVWVNHCCLLINASPTKWKAYCQWCITSCRQHTAN